MVAVGGQVCVDRYESTLVEGNSGRVLSPFYPPQPKLATALFATWSQVHDDERSGAKVFALPELPPFQQSNVRAVAASWAQSIPSAYVSGDMAKQVCQATGKRLCTESEWVTACRGSAQTLYPYGERYEQSACNVFGDHHPGHILHGNSSTGLLDPRLNQVMVDGQRLLRPTGTTPRCVSRWGNDGIYDMVGNLDEWIDDPDGTFVGGFYARGTRSGCNARVSAHAPNYFDYSTGVRCCQDPTVASAAE